jgi:hypothetical protein
MPEMEKMLPLPIDISKYTKYEKTFTSSDGFKTFRALYGLELEKGKIHRHIDINQFDAHAIKIPPGFKKVKNPNKTYIKQYIYNPARVRLLKTDPKNIARLRKYKGWKKYYTHDNGGRLFLVYVKQNNVAVFTEPDRQSEPYIADVDTYHDTNHEWTYAIPVAKYTNVVRVWPGKSPKTEMTKFSHGFGRAFTGNSVLVQISPRRYAFFGHVAYEFQTSDTIAEYWSPVGNNDVPYPVAFGSTHAYFMLDCRQVPFTAFKRRLTKKDKQDLYGIYYGHDRSDDEGFDSKDGLLWAAGEDDSAENKGTEFARVQMLRESV